MPQAGDTQLNSAIGPISSISIDGFQSLVGVDIPLAPGVNVVVGESDVGKSAVIRALQGLIGNQRGDGFINNRTGRCRVSVCVPAAAGESEVAWEKPENSYQVDDDEPFKKVGTSVPPQVLNLVNMAPLELDKGSARSINIVEQGAPKFLVEDKETDVAKTIGAITRLQPVYNAMRAVAGDRRSASSRAKTLCAEAAQSRLKLAAFSDLDSEAERLERAEVSLSDCIRLQADLELLQGISVRLRENANTAAELRGRLGLAEGILRAAEHVKLARAAWKKIDDLISIERGLRAARIANEEMSSRAAAIGKIAGMDITSLEGSAARLASLSTASAKLLGNTEASNALTSIASTLSSVADLAVGEIEGCWGDLDRIRKLKDTLAACDAAAGKLADEARSAAAAAAAAADKVGEFLASASVCPFSGGQLFQECKELIGRQ